MCYNTQINHFSPKFAVLAKISESVVVMDISGFRFIEALQIPEEKLQTPWVWLDSDNTGPV
jgi:hypothetical protein